MSNFVSELKQGKNLNIVHVLQASLTTYACFNVQVKFHRFRTKSYVVADALNNCVHYSVRYVILRPNAVSGLRLKFSVRREAPAIHPSNRYLWNFIYLSRLLQDFVDF
jgi:hypothetical protein